MARTRGVSLFSVTSPVLIPPYCQALEGKQPSQRAAAIDVADVFTGLAALLSKTAATQVVCWAPRPVLTIPMTGWPADYALHFLLTIFTCRI